MTVDTAELSGTVIGVLICRGPGPGPKVSLTRDGDRLLGFGTSGCDQSNLYSAQSQPIGAGGGTAELVIEAEPGIEFSFVLEEVA